ncbi:protein trichome birefringence-like 26 isoform X2 [Amborella trichopoda]|uniref:protein trichome birefringence-like 26 isoform X2 n=1 Tax=Amborella trichopoda TaxID=13333 RepID=UPI0009BD02AE|nr:protein trichome birefringence-like 26 isoform X2 [Amborella trichopoda]|eukprot:XP_020518376.1 protein trichome birefringence-like 26 isoform X2 [Amborella trichopoda]
MVNKGSMGTFSESLLKPWPFSKHKHVLVKLAVALFLMGLAFRLYSSHGEAITPVSNVPISSQIELSSDPPAIDSANDENGGGSESGEKCDLFKGEWIYDPSGPHYTNESCQVIEDHQNCMSNGRPDSGYLYWRWKPSSCNLSQFDGKRFLENMVNKRWGFIGDSISRNHVQSLLCLLSKVESATEIYHDEEYKSKTWHFPSFNFTLAVIWSPFLIKSVSLEDINGVSTSENKLYLDVLDTKWITQFDSFDYVIISGGKWFLKAGIYLENNTVVGCHYCPGKNLTELGFQYSYEKALKLVLNYIINSNHKGLILFRTSTPDHFEKGEWFSGGTCKRTVPFKNGEISMTDVDRILHRIELEVYEKALEEGTAKGLRLELMDTTQLSLLRPDGHPGPYRQFYPFAKDKNATVQNDCLHWCLPGPIDSWNDIVMKIVLDERRSR